LKYGVRVDPNTFISISVKDGYGDTAELGVFVIAVPVFHDVPFPSKVANWAVPVYVPMYAYALVAPIFTSWFEVVGV
jgi:hypothetical protein